LGSNVGGFGFNKLSAIANHSSVAKITLAPRSEDVSSIEVLFQSMMCIVLQVDFEIIDISLRTLKEM
jgi:hypothetical protein